MQESSKELNERFKEIRSQAGLSQAEFANLLEMRQGTISDIERGRIGVSNKLVKKLVEKLKVNQGWFYTGEGEKFIVNNYKSQGYNSGVDTGFRPEDNIFWQRMFLSTEPEKTEDWVKLHNQITLLAKRVGFLYQRIIDVKLLINKTLGVRLTKNIADKEAAAMHSVFMDGAFGNIRANYSTLEELHSYREALFTLEKVFDDRFFELFSMLYQGLSPELKPFVKLPETLD